MRGYRPSSRGPDWQWRARLRLAPICRGSHAGTLGNQFALEEPRLRRSNLDIHQLPGEVRLAREVHQLVGACTTIPASFGGAIHQHVDAFAEVAGVDVARDLLLQRLH